MNARVSILLSTFQGERYLRAQLDSLLAQDFQDWKLWYRDDGSLDSTLKILSDYEKKDSRISQLQITSERLGPTQSFARLLEEAPSTSYYAFCDQDDIWLPNKISRSLERLQSIEKLSPGPCLVFSDLFLMNAEGESVERTAHENLEIKKAMPPQKESLIFQNVVTGCATLFNHDLKKKILPIPSEAILHDHWIALWAFYFGKVSYLSEPLIQYRHHDQNVTGGLKAKGIQEFFPYLFSKKRELIINIEKKIQQARAFKREASLKGSQNSELDFFLKGFEEEKVPSFWWCFKNKVLPLGLKRQMGLAWALSPFFKTARRKD